MRGRDRHTAPLDIFSILNFSFALYFSDPYNFFTYYSGLFFKLTIARNTQVNSSGGLLSGRLSK